MVTLDQAGLARSALVMVQVPAPLRNVVDLVWIDERPRLALASPQWRVVPDDAPHLIYYRYVDGHPGTEHHRLNVVGARSTYVDVDCSRRLFTIGLRLRPGAIPALLRVAAHEITNRSVAAELLARDPVCAALDRLGDDTPLEAARRLTELVTHLAARGRTIDARARQLASAQPLTALTALSVRRTATSLGIGDRALRRWSATHLGVGLRRFLSIRRLHGALQARLEQPAATWSQIAAANGFADHPHLIRDCHALLGESPSEFFARTR